MLADNSNYKLSKWSLALRSKRADRKAMADRLEKFRDVMPSEQPKLIVDTDEELPLPTESFIPECHVSELNAEVLKDAMKVHGGLIVRGLFSKKSLEGMNSVIDQVLSVCDQPRHERMKVSNKYYNPPSNVASVMPKGVHELTALRQFSAASGSALCVETPSVAEMLLKYYEAHGLKELVSDYLGEPACLSAKKWVLRRSIMDMEDAGWHQDGAFMGTEINTINLWIPLSECGGHTGAPGMDVLPARLNKLATSDGADFDWSVADEVVRSAYGAAKPMAPEFDVGDAFFFDHFNIHRTQSSLNFTRQRYAIETWFFGETSFPKSQVPIAW